MPLDPLGSPQVSFNCQDRASNLASETLMKKPHERAVRSRRAYDSRRPVRDRLWRGEQQGGRIFADGKHVGVQARMGLRKSAATGRSCRYLLPPHREPTGFTFGSTLKKKAYRNPALDPGSRIPFQCAFSYKGMSPSFDRTGKSTASTAQPVSLRLGIVISRRANPFSQSQLKIAL